ncbi:MAG TPA: MFS transporter [Clostridia bacterium]|nr:MFS transporter [Clostridia bacterium]
MKSRLSEKNKVFLYMLAAMVLGYLPWYNFSAVSKYIAAEFSLTVNQTGIIMASFQAGYVVVVLVTGWLADRVGERKVVAWATLCTAIFSTLFAFLAKDFTSILILRLITGLSAGAIYIPGMALLSSWFPPDERGRVLGAYTGALTLAYAGGYFVAAPIAAAYNWRYGMLWTSLPAFIAAFIVFFLVKEKPSDMFENVKAVQRIKGEQEIQKSAPGKEYAGPILITTGYMGHMWELYTFWGWIGPFMVACSLASGYDEAQAVAIGGQLAAFIILLGVPSVWLAGIAADKIGRTKTIIVCAFSSLIMEFFFGYLYGKSLAIVVIVGLWIGFWVVADSAIYKAGMTEMVNREIRATALGVESAFGYFMTILSPFIFGKVLDRMNLGIKDATLATNWGLPFLILGAGALLAPVSIFILRRLPQAKLMSNGKM